MYGAPQVRIERREGGECLVTDVAFIASPVPSAVGNPRPDDLRPRRRGPLNEPRRVGDDPAFVVVSDEIIDHLARHPRNTGSRLEMEDEGGSGDKRSSTILHRAADGSGLVDGGSLMLTEVVLVDEHALA